MWESLVFWKKKKRQKQISRNVLGIMILYFGLYSFGFQICLSGLRSIWVEGQVKLKGEEGHRGCRRRQEAPFTAPPILSPQKVIQALSLLPEKWSVHLPLLRWWTKWMVFSCWSPVWKKKKKHFVHFAAIKGGNFSRAICSPFVSLLRGQRCDLPACALCESLRTSRQDSTSGTRSILTAIFSLILPWL